MSAWATWAEYVLHCVTIIKILSCQKFYTSNMVWDIPCRGGPSRRQSATNPRSWQACLEDILSMWFCGCIFTHICIFIALFLHFWHAVQSFLDIFQELNFPNTLLVSNKARMCTVKDTTQYNIYIYMVFRKFIVWKKIILLLT